MSFIKELPVWNKAGTAPNPTKQTEGWGVLEHPPADWFNWQWHATYLALKELQENAIHEDQIGQPGGVAPVGPDGKISDEYLPGGGLDGGNSAVVEVSSILLETDTRTNPLTYTNGNLTKIESKDGATVVATTDYIYNGARLDSIVESAGGKSVTTKMIYDVNGNLIDIQSQGVA